MFSSLEWHIIVNRGDENDGTNNQRVIALQQIL